MRMLIKIYPAMYLQFYCIAVRSHLSYDVCAHDANFNFQLNNLMTSSFS